MSKSAVPAFEPGFTCSRAGDAPCEVICLLELLIGSRSYSPLSIVWTFSDPRLLCPLLTSASGSEQIALLLVRLDVPQTSRSKFTHFWYTTAGFTLPVLDGYGLCDLMLTRPTFTPLIQFLFVGSYLCSTLPSDLTSR